MAYPLRHTPFTAAHLVAALAASTNLRLSVMGALKRMTPEEELSILHELAFTIEEGVRSASGSAEFERVNRHIVNEAYLASPKCTVCGGAGMDNHLNECRSCGGTGVLL